MEQKVIFTSDINISLIEYIRDIDFDRIFILTDTNTEKSSLPVLNDFCKETPGIAYIKIEAGDENKNINSLNHIGTQLSSNGATRHPLMINLY